MSDTQPAAGAGAAGGASSEPRVRPHGKFLDLGGSRFPVKGVSYGTFAPDPGGDQFPPVAQADADFALMARYGFNTVRTYTEPRDELLDRAAARGLRLMVGVPWPQHTAFLAEARVRRTIRQQVHDAVRRLARHPAVMLVAVGHEIPAGVVRWHGPSRVEAFLRDLYDAGKDAAPEVPLTYCNFPPTEYLDLPFFDVCAFNVYLHRPSALGAYLARLQHVAGHRPLLLAETGADSLRHGEAAQAALAARQVREAFRVGACGAVAFTWTDDWWRGGHPVDDWAFGLVTRERKPKPALEAVARVFTSAADDGGRAKDAPLVSVVVCAHNAAGTLDDCLQSLGRLRYENVEILVVNDGSTDRTGAIARRYPVRLVEVENGGLSAARNLGAALAAGDIVAYTDADVRVDPDWLTFLVRAFDAPDVVAAGGPNVVPEDDSFVAQCVARAPGGPTHVMLDDRIAEHVPGCNLAVRRDALNAVGGFDPVFVRAGDDVDLCWRLQARGWRIAFAPAALVWHHHRSSLRAYWRQQVGYGEGETWLQPRHPDKFPGSGPFWQGRIYAPLPAVRSLDGTRIDAGVWGTALFPGVYRTPTHPLAHLPHTAAWQLGASALVVVAALLVAAGERAGGALAGGAGLAAAGVTIARCVRHALRTNVDGVALAGVPRVVSRVAARALIAWLHVIQPLARLHGRLRGRLKPPGPAGRPAPAPAPPPLGWWWLRWLAGRTDEVRFWSETPVDGADLLADIAARLRAASLPWAVEVDDGSWTRRDISLRSGFGQRVDLGLLVEDHGGGRCLVRTGIRVDAGGLTALAGACGALVAAAAVVSAVTAAAGVVAVGAAAFATRALGETGRAGGYLRAVVGDAALAAGLTRLDGDRASVPARPQAKGAA